MDESTRSTVQITKIQPGHRAQRGTGSYDPRHAMDMCLPLDEDTRSIEYTDASTNSEVDSDDDTLRCEDADHIIAKLDIAYNDRLSTEVTDLTDVETEVDPESDIIFSENDMEAMSSASEASDGYSTEGTVFTDLSELRSDDTDEDTEEES